MEGVFINVMVYLVIYNKIIYVWSSFISGTELLKPLKGLSDKR